MSVYSISKDFQIAVSHQLSTLPDSHKCSRVHGHNVTVRVELRAPTLDAHGFVLDYGLLAPVKDYLDSTLDHRHLNDLVPFSPSAENMAKHLHTHCRMVLHLPVHRVGWSETPNTWAWYWPGMG